MIMKLCIFNPIKKKSSMKKRIKDQFNVLLFTYNDDWYSDCIPPIIEAFQKMSEKNQYNDFKC